MTTTTIPAKPIIGESESAALTLSSYVMHINTQLCTHCDDGERFSTLFEVWTHPTATRLNGFKKLLPVFGVKIDKSLPIAVIELPTKPIPYCSECAATAAADAAQPAVTTVASRAAWAATLQRKATEAASTTIPSKPTKLVPTLDML
jgi:hypothetical protein